MNNIEEMCNMHESGVKDDLSKPDMDLVLKGFSKALTDVCKLGTFGAVKYTELGFLDVPNGIRRYSSAMQRHYFLEDDEEYDDETKLLHATAVAWNSLARLELMLRKKNDNCIL